MTMGSVEVYGGTGTLVGPPLICDDYSDRRHRFRNQPMGRYIQPGDAGENWLRPITIRFLAVVDPELMVTVPQGILPIRGLMHCSTIRRLCSNGVNILSEAIALSPAEVLQNISPMPLKDGSDIEAREHIAYGGA